MMPRGVAEASLEHGQFYDPFRVGDMSPEVLGVADLPLCGIDPRLTVGHPSGILQRPQRLGFRQSARWLPLLLALAFSNAARAFTVYDPITLNDLSAQPGDGGLGWSVAPVGDVNGDGVDDVAAGAPFKDKPGQLGTNHGLALLFSGASGGLILVLENPAPDAFLGFGKSLAGTGDLDGDGVPDVAVGASGGAYVVSGADGSVVWTLVNPNPPGSIPAGPEQFGARVVSNFDLNGDARGDILVSAPLQEQVFVFSGADASVLLTIDKPPVPGSDFGMGAAAVGDVSGDGVIDFLIGAPNTSGALVGMAFVMSGADGTLLLPLDDPVGGSSLFGWAVAAVEDLNGDGNSELLIGAPAENIGPNAQVGRAFVFNGATGNLIFQLANPVPQEGGGFGWSVTTLRDGDGDGFAELVIGAPGNQVGKNDDQGQVFIFSGATGDLLKTIHDPNPQADGDFGTAVAGARFINADTIEDLLVGAPGKTIKGTAFVGQAFLFISTFVRTIFLEPSLRGATQAHVYFLGLPGERYRIESIDSLSRSDWLERATVTASAFGLLEFIDPPPLPPQGFYRAVSP